MYPPSLRHKAIDLLGNGAALAAVSRELGVSRSTLREWVVKEGRYAPRMEGRTCPDVHALDEPRYVHLLGLYLGDGCISSQPRGVYLLRIACDARYRELIEECRESVAAVLPNTVGLSRAPGCVYVTSYSKHWPCLFPQHGPGRKHERPIVLEDWQRDLVERLPGRFLRGLFHSDGCRVTNRVTRQVGGRTKTYTYPRYFFTNVSTDILELAEWALDLLGVEHRRPTARNVSVAQRESVALLDQHVAPKQ